MFRDHRDKLGARIGLFEQLENRRLLAACPLPPTTTSSSTATSAVVGSATAGAKAATATTAATAAKVAAAASTTGATQSAGQQAAPRFGGPQQGLPPGGGGQLRSQGSTTQSAPTQATVLTAEAIDATTGATASIRYQTCTNGTATSTQLLVSVAKATASSKLAVTVDGVSVGSITTDANGSGMLILSSNAKTGSSSLPADFPTTVAAGSTVAVGDTLTGTLAVSTATPPAAPKGPRGPGGPVGQGAGLSASLSDAATGATANVMLQTCTVNGVTNTRLGVLVSKAAANATLDVTLDGVVVGTITTDASGSGSLLLSSNPRKGEVALPATFPTTVAAGSTVTVGSLSGALAASGATSGGTTSSGVTTVATAAKLSRK